MQDKRILILAGPNGAGKTDRCGLVACALYDSSLDEPALLDWGEKR
jgi:hypothetical protein